MSSELRPEVLEVTASSKAYERAESYERSPWREGWVEGWKEGQWELAEWTIPWLIENGVSEEGLRLRFGLTVSKFDQIKNGAAAPDSD